MLFILTGDIQTGKTRWLLRQVDALEAVGVQVCGVVAPGTWIDHGRGAIAPASPGGKLGRYEKTGIDNLLLPERRIVPFARRRDLADDLQADSQSERAGLGWAISDGSIAEVNGHFEKLAAIGEPGRRLLVVDEIGRLELERAGGLANAVAMLDRGATPAFPHALAVVREQLLGTALSRFGNAAWHGMRAIGPTEEAARQLAAELLET